MIKNPDTTKLSAESLLELSLSVGKYPDRDRSIETFINCLTQQLDHHYCEVWQKSSDRPALIYSNSKERIIPGSCELGNDSPLFQVSEQKGYRIFSAQEIARVIQAPSLPSLSYILVHLHENYYLLFTAEASNFSIDPANLVSLMPIFNRFGITLQQNEYRQDVPTAFTKKTYPLTPDRRTYDLIVKNISEGIIICDLEGKIRYINNRTLELGEFEPSEVENMYINELPISDESVNEVFLMLKEVFEDGKQFEYTALVETLKNKRKWWAKSNLSPYRDANGKIIGAIALIRDISTDVLIKNTQKALKEIRDQYNLVINQGFDGVLTYDLYSGKLLEVNKAFLKKIGYKKKAFLNLELEDVSPPNQANGISSKAYLAKINQQLRDGKKRKISYEWVHKRKDDTLYYVEIVAIRLEAPNDHIKIEIHQDITQKYLAQKALKENRERLDTYFDRSPIAILIRSLDSHQFERVNQKFKDLFGYSQEELNTMNRGELVFQEDRTFIEKQMDRLLRKEIPSFRVEKQYIRKNGETFWGAATRSLVELENETLMIGFIEDISKQKEAQAALEESEAKVRSIFNSSEDKIFALAPDFKLIYFNKAANEFTKHFYNKEFNIGDELKATDRPIPEEWLNYYRLALKGESSTVRREYEYLGENRIDLISILPNRDPKGNVIGITIYGKDITALEHAKKEVEKSKALLQEGERIGKFGNWSLDLTTGKVYWSDGTYLVYERPKEKGPFTMEEFEKYVHKDDFPQYKKGVEGLKRGEPAESMEFRVYTETGRLIHLAQRVENVWEDGKLVKIFGTSQDITELKKAENLAKESNQRYQDLFDNMYDAMLTTNAEGKFVNVNKATERLLEYTLDELRNMRIKDIVYSEDMEKSKRYLKKLLKDGFYSNYQGRIVTKTGKIKYLQVNSNAIIKDGQIVGSRDIARDITDLKLAEQKREQLYAELEQANKELQDFAYIVSHDLKAPLRAISSLSSWIAEDYKDLFDAEGKKHLELLIGRTKRMQNFIEGILQYSRLGRTKMAYEEFDPNQLINEIIKDLNPPKQFNVKIENEIPPIRAQKIRIQQVFQNLISNAIKYNDKEFGQMIIRYEDAVTHHQFYFKDNGPGIEAKHFDKIFQIFQTLHARDQLESTGIGLTIVKKIVELHDGDIAVHSKIGEGTTFIFTLAK